MCRSCNKPLLQQPTKHDPDDHRAVKSATASSSHGSSLKCWHNTMRRPILCRVGVPLPCPVNSSRSGRSWKGIAFRLQAEFVGGMSSAGRCLYVAGLDPAWRFPVLFSWPALTGTREDGHTLVGNGVSCDYTQSKPGGSS